MCNYKLLKKNPAPRSTTCKIKYRGRKGARKVWALKATPWPLYTPQIYTVTIVQQTLWAWTGTEYLAPHWGSNLGTSNPYKVAVLTELSRPPEKHILPATPHIRCDKFSYESRH